MNVTQRLALSGLTVAVVAAVLAAFLYTVSDAARMAPPLRDDLPACVTEDDPGPCVWDSQERGNGHAGPGVQRYILNH